MKLLLVASFFLALFSSGFLTWCVRKLAVVRGWSGPSSPHHLHDGAVPRVGGVAVFGAILISLLAGEMITRSLAPSELLLVGEEIAAAALVFALGVWDDFQPITAVTKLTCESMAALLLFLAGVRVQHLPMVAEPLSPVLSLLITTLFVIGITNAFNLIDGLDGLAAGTAAVSTAIFLVLAVFSGNLGIAWLAVVLLGAIAGFLPFNTNPATIFLGDCGSLLIGFVISVFTIITIDRAHTLPGVAVPVLAIGLPVLDTFVAIVRRSLGRRSIFVPDRQHVHHMLLENGHSHRSAVLFLYCVSGVFGCLSLALLLRQSLFPLVLLISATTAATTIFIGYRHGLHPAEPAAEPPLMSRLEGKQAVFRRVTSQLRHVQTFPELWYTLEAACSAAHLVGYDVRIPGPLDALDLRSWGFSVDTSGPQYVRSFRNGGDGKAGDVVLAVQFSSRKRSNGEGELKIYFTQPLEMEHSLPAGFPVVLSDAMTRILRAAEHDSRTAADDRQLRVFPELDARHSDASGTAD